MTATGTLRVAPLRRHNTSGVGGRADSSPTASKRRKSQRPLILADPASLGADSRTGMLLGGHSAWQIGQNHHAIVNYFFFPVTSSHFSPSSVLILSTFTQASSFICRNTARPAA